METLENSGKSPPKKHRPVTIERIREIKKFEHLSDEEAQKIIDDLKMLVHIALTVSTRIGKDEH